MNSVQIDEQQSWNNNKNVREKQTNKYTFTQPKLQNVKRKTSYKPQ